MNILKKNCCVTVFPCLFLSEMSKCKLDLGLLVDTTKSIKEENIPKVKEALRKLVNKFSISTNGTHVSLLTFHKKSKIHNKFNDDRFHNNKAMEGLINSSFVTLLQPTRLDIALKTANSMLDDKSGKRSSTRCVMVLFTDGRSHPATEEFFLEVVGIKASIWNRTTSAAWKLRPRFAFCNLSYLLFWDFLWFERKFCTSAAASNFISRL